MTNQKAVNETVTNQNKKYHYLIEVDLNGLEVDLANHMFNTPAMVEIDLDTANRLDPNELLIVTSNDCLVALKIKYISRIGFQYNLEENILLEMDMTQRMAQKNRPRNTTDEVWYSCKAEAMLLSDAIFGIR